MVAKKYDRVCRNRFKIIKEFSSYKKANSYRVKNGGTVFRLGAKLTDGYGVGIPRH